MRGVIYKYLFPSADIEPGVYKIPMQPGASIFCARFQNDYLCLWAVSPVPHPTAQPELKTRLIRVVFTGEIFDFLPAKEIYIDTLQDYRGLVYHVFDLGYEQ